MDVTAFHQISANRNKTIHGDRFIPVRRNNNYEMLYFEIIKSNRKNDLQENDYSNQIFLAYADLNSKIVNLGRPEYYKQAYETELQKLNKIPQRKFLIFSPIRNKMTNQNPGIRVENMWPVIPRKKPLITRPEIILDMPGFSNTTGLQLIDWSVDDYFIYINGQKIYLSYQDFLGSPNTQFITQLNKSINNCVTFDKLGEHVAIPSTTSNVFIINYKSRKESKIITCLCEYCSVHCIEYTFHNYLITCCNQGRCCVFNSSYKQIAYKKHHLSRITVMKSSCFGKYVALQDDRRTISVFQIMPKLDTYIEEIPINASMSLCFSWHPWNENLLAIGTENNLILYNVVKKAKIFDCPQFYETLRVDCMRFNPISAELVLSVTIIDGTKILEGLIIVAKDFNTKVEAFFGHRAAVQYLVWNGDGTQLASAGSDETLSMWHFFGTAENGKRMTKKKPEPISIDSFKTLSKFGPLLR